MLNASLKLNPNFNARYDVTSRPSPRRSLTGTPTPSPKLYDPLLSEKVVVLPLARARLPESSCQFIPRTAFRWKWSAMGQITMLLRKKFVMAVFPISDGHTTPGTPTQGYGIRQ